jgi:hypothetical protein
MTRLLGFLRARLNRLRMVRAGLLERDGARYVLTGKGQAFSSMRDALGTRWRS